MAEDPWEALKKNFVVLSKKLELNDTLASVLYQEGFVDRQEYDRLRSWVSIDEHSSNVDFLLLDRLPRQSSARYGIFCECLRKSGQDHLADILEYGERKPTGITGNIHSQQQQPRLPVSAQSSDSSDTADASLLAHSMNHLDISAISTSQTNGLPFSSQIRSPSTSSFQSSTPFQDIDVRSNYDGQWNTRSGGFGSGSSTSSFHRLSRGHSVAGSGPISGLQNQSGSGVYSSDRPVTVSGPMDQGPAFMPVPDGVQRRCSTCSQMQRKVAYYKDDLERKIEQIVHLEEKLTEKDDYCCTLEQTVAKLDHLSRGVKEANSALIAKLQSAPPARQANSTLEKPPQWVVGNADTSSMSVSQSLISNGVPVQVSTDEQFQSLQVSIQTWLIEHGENATADQLYKVIVQQGKKPLADRLFAQETRH